jgi:hypothetical protein
MKKKVFMIFAAITLLLGFGFVNNVNAAFNQSNLSSVSGSGFTYEDPTLAEGWYNLVFVEEAIDYSGGYPTISYYTGDCLTAYSLGTSDYVEPYDITDDLEYRIYIKDGIFKFSTTATDLFVAAELESGTTLTLYALNELKDENLTVTADELVYTSNLLDGWYHLTLEDSVFVGTGTLLLGAQYYTDDLSIGETITSTDNIQNLTSPEAGVHEIDIRVLNGNFKIYSPASFDVSIGNVTNINLTLIELITPPVFNYTELILEADIYDLPTVAEVTAMLTASDSEDGDLTSSITVYDENITDFTIGDDYIKYYVLDENSTSWSVEGDISDYDLYLLNDDGLYIKISTFTHEESIAITGVFDTTTMTGWTLNTSRYTTNWRIEDQAFGAELIFNDDGSFVNDILGEIPHMEIALVRKDRLSEYYITYSVEDLSGNKSYLTVDFELTNNIAGYFSYSDTLNNINIAIDEESEIIEINVDASDYNDSSFMNDMYQNFAMNYDYTFCSQDLALNENNVTNYYDYKNLVGFFIFSDDELEYEITLHFNVTDDIAPSFEDTPNYLYVSNAAEITTTQLETYIEKSDNATLEANITVALLSNDYTANKAIIGRYEVVYSLEDAAGNLAYHTFVVYVVDQTPPIFAFPELFEVNVYENDPISEENLEDALVSHGIIVTELSFTIDIIEGDYLENSTTRGDYTMRLLITYEDESTEIIDLKIEVIAEPDETITNPDDDTITPPGSAAITTPTETPELLGLAWYWWVMFAVVGYAVLGTKKGRKTIGLKK